MSMTEDLSVFFDTQSGFADTALLAGVGVVGIAVCGYEDRPIAGSGPLGSSPEFHLPAAGLPARPEGLSLVITSGIGVGSYKVGHTTPDGTGIQILHLLPT
jgi:hypothetical protein